MTQSGPPCIVWRFSDRIAGHDNQSAGLLRGLAQCISLEVHTLAVHAPVIRTITHWLTGRYPDASPLPPPHLIIGAGHRTHLPMLAARRAYGGRIVVLMKPSLPLRWFDLCIVPEHDGVAPAANVMVTRGALTSVAPAADKDEGRGMFLIGGPSPHFGWDEEQLLQCIDEIAARAPLHWTVATSRRTPVAFIEHLSRRAPANVKVVPWEQAAPGWLADELGRAAQAWVTEDSVSMVYEALTAGAACGLLPVPCRREGRVVQGLRRLTADGWVTPFHAWRDGKVLQAAREPFDEAQRSAREVCRRWFPGH